MKKPFEIGLLAMGVSLFAVAGIALYRMISMGDQVRCVANEITFGCFSTLWQVMICCTALAAVVLVSWWQRFRNR